MFIQFYYLLPQRLHFETSGGFRTKRILQTLCTTFLFCLFVCLFQQFCFKVSSLYKRHTTYTKSIEHLNLLILIYKYIFLVKTLINFNSI